MNGVGEASLRFVIQDSGFQPVNSGGVKASDSILLKISDLNRQFGSSPVGMEKCSLTLSVNFPKHGLVHALFTQFRKEGKAPEEPIANLVHLFESSGLEKDSGQEEVAENLEAPNLEEIEEESEEGEALLSEEDLEAEEEALEMQEGGFEEGDSSFLDEDSLEDESIKEMIKRSKTILLEKWKTDKKSYISLSEWIPSLKQLNGPYAFFHLEWGVAADKGFQPNMEETFFSEECEEGVLVGILGGNNLQKPSFAPFLLKEQGDVEKALQGLMKQLDPMQESDVLICFIDKKKGFIYTAGWGTNQASIYRKIGQKYKTISLSPMGHRGFSVQVALNMLQVGDTLILASFGCKKVLSEEEIQFKVEKEKGDLALSLLNDAIYVKGSLDNATVVSLKII